MNNLKQKNVVYGQDRKAALPHPTRESVRLSQNSNITDARVDNAFQQLVNNDLYLENRMIADISYQPGPEKTSSAQEISELPDGAKIWTNSDDYSQPLRINMKKDKPLSQSVRLARAASVNFMFNFGNVTFIAFSDTFMYDAGQGLVDCMCGTARVAATGYYTCGSGAFVVSDSALYRIKTLLDNASGNVTYSLEQIDIGSVTGLKAVAYDEANNKIYVAGGSGYIARGRYDSGSSRVNLVQDVKFCRNNIYGAALADNSYYGNDIAISALEILDSADYSVNAGGKMTNVLAATDKGLYRSDVQTFLDQVSSSAFGSETSCVAMVSVGDDVYALAQSGELYRKTGSSSDFQRYPSGSDVFSGAKSMAVHQSGLYIAYDGGISRFTSYDPAQRVVELSRTDGFSAVAVTALFGDRIVFAAAGNTVYYYTDPRKVYSFQVDSGYGVEQLVPQIRKNASGVIDLYIRARLSSGQAAVYAAYMHFSQNTVLDYGKIYGLESIADQVDAIACGNGNCYYANSGTVYSTSGVSRRIGGVTVRQIEYLSAGNTLAVAADNGVYLMNADTLNVIDQKSGLPNTMFVSQSRDTVYYATSSRLYAVRKTQDGTMGAYDAQTDVAGGISGLAAADDRVYVLGADSHKILSASLVDEYQASYVDDDGAGDAPVVNMKFPVMPYMEEANASCAVGISADRLFRLDYVNDSDNCREITCGGVAGDTAVKAFCKAGENVFIAFENNIYRYAVDADSFDPANLADMTPVSNIASSATDLVYSGTDTTFDMRIYANTASGWKKYVPSRTNTAKLSCGAVFSDFLSYIDSNDPDDGTDPVFKAVTVGINGANLSVNVNTVTNSGSSWDGGWRSYQLSNDAGQTERQPYALYFPANSRVYVAYTAKTGSTFADCIAAVTTDNLQDTAVTSDTPDTQVIFSGMASRTQNIRFSGFSVNSEPEIGEDIDVIAAYSSGKIITLKVDGDGGAMQRGETPLGSYYAPTAEYFQPDCMVIDGSPSRYYITLPCKSSNNIIIDLYEYNKVGNNCSRIGRYTISDIESGTTIKDVFIVGSPYDSPDIVDFLVYVGTNRAYYLRIGKGETVSWDTEKTAAKSFGTTFSKIRRFGPNQLIGYGVTFIYDFQTRTNYGGSDIGNVYLTDNGDSRDYMLYLNRSDTKIYSSDPNMAMTFADFPSDTPDGIKSKNSSYVKADNVLFVIDWTGNKIYKENVTGGFDIAAENLSFNSNKIGGGVYAENGKHYLCVMRSSGKSDIYEFGEEPIRKSVVYNNTPVSDSDSTAYISRIVYQSSGSQFKKYVRYTLFQNDQANWNYCRPIMADSGNEGNFAYLPKDADVQPVFSALQQIGSNTYRRIGKNGDIPYGVRPDGTGVTSLTIEMLLPGSGTKSISGSKDAWYVGNGYFGQTGSGGKFDDGTGTFSDFGAGKTFSDIAGAAGGPYYFLDSGKTLYRSEGLLVRPLTYAVQKFKIDNVDDFLNFAPVRLVQGRVYAAVVCGNAGSQVLFILWPMGQPESDVTAESEGSGSADSGFQYGVAAVQASFWSFPDEGQNMSQIVPLGDFLDEIVVYEGGFLHIARVQDRLLIQDKSGKSQIPVIETLPYTEFAETFGFAMSASAKAGKTRFVACSTGGINYFSDAISGIAMKILSLQMKNDGVSARSFLRTGQNEFLIATDKGVYRYMHIDGVPRVNRMSLPAGFDVKQIASYDFNGMGANYVMANASDNFMYRSENGRLWKRDFKPVSGVFSSVYPKNEHDWYFGSSAGLYKSVYEYTEADDLQKFSETDLYGLYNDLMASTISANCAAKIAQHEISKSYRDGHVQSLMYDINTNLMGVDFNGLRFNGWQMRTGGLTGPDICYQVQNDIVFEQRWGDQDDWDITLSVGNMFVKDNRPKFTYLFRRWMSGFTEIYVHIPTTNTYYVNHVQSTPGYTMNPEDSVAAENVSKFGKDKMQFAHNPNTKGVYTTISLALSRGMFKVDALIGAQACGNSLPLKIYRDTVDVGNFFYAQYFNSYIAPTTLISRRSADEGDVFDFACFGADEQVIRLEFIDTVFRPDDTYYRIIFNPNDSSTDDKKYVKQRIKIDGKEYSLRRNQYSWPEDRYRFIGWSFEKLAKDSSIDNLRGGFYEDAQSITSTEIEERMSVLGKPLKPGDDVTLYAVWLSYSFSDSDTTVTLVPPAGKTNFKISKAETLDNEDKKIDNKHVVLRITNAG